MPPIRLHCKPQSFACGILELTAIDTRLTVYVTTKPKHAQSALDIKIK
jgi:hypothetical protein